jgi:hypothetical protein
LLPQGSLVVPGHYCPQARLGAAISTRADLDMLCPGWDWPASPGATLDAALASARPVAINVTAADWWAHEAANFSAVQAWRASHAGRDVGSFFVVER